MLTTICSFNLWATTYKHYTRHHQFCRHEASAIWVFSANGRNPFTKRNVQFRKTFRGKFQSKRNLKPIFSHSISVSVFHGEFNGTKFLFRFAESNKKNVLGFPALPLVCFWIYRKVSLRNSLTGFVCFMASLFESSSQSLVKVEDLCSRGRTQRLYIVCTIRRLSGLFSFRRKVFYEKPFLSALKLFFLVICHLWLSQLRFFWKKILCAKWISWHSEGNFDKTNFTKVAQESRCYCFFNFVFIVFPNNFFQSENFWTAKKKQFLMKAAFF